MARFFSIPAGWGWVLAFAACASSPVGLGDALRRGRVGDALFAYERSEPSLPALQRVAALSLEQAAQTDAPRASAQALAALARATPLAERVLARLAERAKSPATRALALATLARFGDIAARSELREKLEDPDAEVRAAALETLDPNEAADLDRLRVSSVEPALVVRAAAVRRLMRAQPDAVTLRLLAERARLDPAPSVRIAALAALGAQGPAAADEIEASLEAPQPALRLAAIAALVASDHERAFARLARYLSDEPSAEGIEAARVLLSARRAAVPASVLGQARVQLAHGLTDRDNALRAAAAVALMSSPDAQLVPAARLRAAQEAVRSVRFALAFVLRSADARALLQELGTRDDLVAAQAEAELARRGDQAAVERLLKFASAANPLVRSIAVRVLAQELGRAHAVRAALLDRDANVRIAAAGAILAAAG